MMEQKYLCYTYLIGWSKMNLWYYGVRYAQTKRKRDYDLWTDYFTHSIPVKHMRVFIGEPDVIHYDKTFDSIDKAKAYENKVLQEHDCKNSILWLNKNDVPAPPVMKGESNFMYGRMNYNGKKVTIEKKEFLSIAEAARYYDKPISTIRLWIKNGKKTNREELKKHMSNSRKGKNNNFYEKNIHQNQERK